MLQPLLVFVRHENRNEAMFVVNDGFETMANLPLSITMKTASPKTCQHFQAAVLAFLVGSFAFPTFAMAQDEMATEETIVAANSSLAGSLIVDLQSPPEPGGYMPGLTKPVQASIHTRFWGPGIVTPPPGGSFAVRRWNEPQQRDQAKSNQTSRAKEARESKKAVLSAWRAEFNSRKKAWKSVDHKHSIQAVFVELNSESVILKDSNEKIVTVPLDKLDRRSLIQAVKQAFQ